MTAPTGAACPASHRWLELGFRVRNREQYATVWQMTDPAGVRLNFVIARGEGYLEQEVSLSWEFGLENYRPVSR